MSGCDVEIGNCADRGFRRPVQEGVEARLKALSLLLQSYPHVEHLRALHLGLEDILLRPLPHGILGFGKGDEVIEDLYVLVHDLQRLVGEIDLVVRFRNHPAQFELPLLHLPFVGFGLLCRHLSLQVPLSPEGKLLGDPDHLLGHGVFPEVERVR